jgi:integrase
MPVAKITKSLVDALLPGDTVWDTEVKGFGVRCQKAAVSYVLKRHSFGAQRYLTIGKHGSPWTPALARKEAIRLLNAIVVERTDPARSKAAERAAYTLRQLAEDFLALHVEPKRKASTAAHYRDLLLRIIVPKLGGRKAADVTRSEIAALHLSMKQRPYQANRVLAVVSAMYTFGQRREIVFQLCNPARAIERFPERSRERHLSDEELARLGEALRVGESEGFRWNLKQGAAEKHRPAIQKRVTKLDPLAVAAIRLLLFTGARRGEILNLRWHEVDFDQGVMRLGDSKTGRKIVSLNEPALAILRSLPRSGEFVIASPLTGRARVDLNAPWKAIRTFAKLHDVHIHDLRHTHASKGVERGLSLPVIGKLLGHKHAITTQRYAHLGPNPLKDASNLVAISIQSAMNDAA